ncbi:MAG TPA: SDR family NAD(P)-dependent oxidoreductase, partial [Zeimonas sp.]
MSVRESMNLAGRKAIVTGGSRGLGLQIAEALGEMGAEIVITARKQGELDEAVAHLSKQGVRVHAIASDLGKPESVVAFGDAALERLGHCDILVNNAGTTWGAPMAEHPLEAWMKLVNLNLTGVFLLTQHIGKHSMIPRGYGRILIVASIAGLRGNEPGTNHTIAYN